MKTKSNFSVYMLYIMLLFLVVTTSCVTRKDSELLSALTPDCTKSISSTPTEFNFDEYPETSDMSKVSEYSVCHTTSKPPLANSLLIISSDCFTGRDENSQCKIVYVQSDPGMVDLCSGSSSVIWSPDSNYGFSYDLDTKRLFLINRNNYSAELVSSSFASVNDEIILGTNGDSLYFVEQTTDPYHYSLSEYRNESSSIIRIIDNFEGLIRIVGQIDNSHFLLLHDLLSPDDELKRGVIQRELLLVDIQKQTEQPIFTNIDFLSYSYIYYHTTLPYLIVSNGSSVLLLNWDNSSSSAMELIGNRFILSRDKKKLLSFSANEVDILYTESMEIDRIFTNPDILSAAWAPDDNSIIVSTLVTSNSDGSLLSGLFVAQLTGEVIKLDISKINIAPGFLSGLVPVSTTYK
ncbi:MAG: hypothetical protein WA110_00550 [Anaerolineaceae bacterium]